MLKDSEIVVAKFIEDDFISYINEQNQSGFVVELVVGQGPAGPKGEDGAKGEPGDVGGSLPWDNITNKPTSFRSKQDLFLFSIPATEFSMTHNMSKFPRVLFQESGGVWYENVDVEHLDANNLIAKFTYATTGQFFLD